MEGATYRAQQPEVSCVSCGTRVPASEISGGVARCIACGSTFPVKEGLEGPRAAGGPLLDVSNPPAGIVAELRGDTLRMSLTLRRWRALLMNVLIAGVLWLFGGVLAVLFMGPSSFGEGPSIVGVLVSWLVFLGAVGLVYVGIAGVVSTTSVELDRRGLRVSQLPLPTILPKNLALADVRFFQTFQQTIVYKNRWGGEVGREERYVVQAILTKGWPVIIARLRDDPSTAEWIRSTLHYHLQDLSAR